MLVPTVIDNSANSALISIENGFIVRFVTDNF